MKIEDIIKELSRIKSIYLDKESISVTALSEAISILEEKIGTISSYVRVLENCDCNADWYCPVYHLKDDYYLFDEDGSFVLSEIENINSRDEREIKVKDIAFYEDDELEKLLKKLEDLS